MDVFSVFFFFFFGGYKELLIAKKIDGIRSMAEGEGSQ
jgi:hypothetical protein